MAPCDTLPCADTDTTAAWKSATTSTPRRGRRARGEAGPKKATISSLEGLVVVVALCFCDVVRGSEALGAPAGWRRCLLILCVPSGAVAWWAPAVVSKCAVAVSVASPPLIASGELDTPPHDLPDLLEGSTSSWTSQMTTRVVGRTRKGSAGRRYPGACWWETVAGAGNPLCNKNTAMLTCSWRAGEGQGAHAEVAQSVERI